MLKLLIFTIIFGFSSNCYGQQNQLEVKNKFKKAIEKELSYINAYHKNAKENPSKRLQYIKSHSKWFAFYGDFKIHAYDITKTNSRISQYSGIVEFIGVMYAKSGETKEDCLKSDWEEAKMDRVGSVSKQTLKFAYQEDVWVLTDAPVDYSKFKKVILE